jgi:hypothetical protein
MGETLAAGVRRLLRSSELSGSGLSNAPPIGVLGHGIGAMLSGIQAGNVAEPSTGGRHAERRRGRRQPGGFAGFDAGRPGALSGRLPGPRSDVP